MQAGITLKLKEDADRLLKEQNYEEAVKQYSRALDCHSTPWMRFAFPDMVAQILVKRAECHFKLVR